MSLPDRLAHIVRLFESAPRELRLQALFDYSKRVPPLPDHIDASEMEPVPECQTPFSLWTELDDEGRVQLYFAVPEEAPTVRGYAGILHEGLSGETPDAILAVPSDFYDELGLAEVVSPLRLRGMGAILTRLRHQVAQLAA